MRPGGRGTPARRRRLPATAPPSLRPAVGSPVHHWAPDGRACAACAGRGNRFSRSRARKRQHLHARPSSPFYGGGRPPRHRARPPRLPRQKGCRAWPESWACMFGSSDYHGTGQAEPASAKHDGSGDRRSIAQGAIRWSSREGLFDVALRAAFATPEAVIMVVGPCPELFWGLTADTPSKQRHAARQPPAPSVIPDLRSWAGQITPPSTSRWRPSSFSGGVLLFPGHMELLHGRTDSSSLPTRGTRA